MTYAGATYIGTTYGGGTSPQPNKISTEHDIAFNNYNLASSTICIYRTDWGTPTIQYTDQAKPRADGSIFISSFFRGRAFTLSGYVLGSCEADFQSNLDDLKKNVLGVNEKYLIYLERDGTYRKIKCSCINIREVREHYNNSWQDIEIEFKTSEPFFSLVENKSESYNIITTGHVEEISPGGTTYSEPRITLIFEAGTTATDFSIQVGDRTLTYTGAITTNDIFVINSQDSTFTKNSVDTPEFGGTFPIFEQGINTIELNVTGTFSCIMNIIYPSNYK